MKNLLNIRYLQNKYLSKITLLAFLSLLTSCEQSSLYKQTSPQSSISSSSFDNGVTSLYHPSPYDEKNSNQTSTLDNIVDAISDETYAYIDIAMYSFGSTTDFPSNPIIRALASDEIQKRIKQKDLQIRMIYGGKAKEIKGDTKKTENGKAVKYPYDRCMLEYLGVDVRYIDGSVQNHNKFGIFLSQDARDSMVISGSANWSKSSANNYDENILFTKNEDGLTRMFADEFQKLWDKAATEFTVASSDCDFAVSEMTAKAPFDSIKITKTKTVESVEPPYEDLSSRSSDDLKAFFNSENYTYSYDSERKKIKIAVKKADEDGSFTLTRQLVSAIDDAKESLQIATTRIRSLPIYKSIIRAALRGVRVEVVMHMSEYAHPLEAPASEISEREEKPCDMDSDPDFRESDSDYLKKCSEGVRHAFFLSDAAQRLKLPLTVKIKYFFSNNPSAFVAKQMHSKYAIIDERHIYSGAFNWSFSSDTNFFENYVYIDGSKHRNALKAFLDNFATISYVEEAKIRDLQQEVQKGRYPLSCSDYGVITAELSEIDKVYKLDNKRTLFRDELCKSSSDKNENKDEVEAEDPETVE
ncbi:MAG: hypothetical protein KBD78_07245 [Oligoflexales bacterium]|nr:hypothetical protein [Oligoflexales bacterium]